MMIITNETQLRERCEDVSIFEAQQLVETLEAQLDSTDGIGLAAIQIGINKRACIIRYNNKKLNLVNPIITAQYDLLEFENEGCLSFPDQWIRTKRYAEVVVKDLFNPTGLILTGIEAVIVQHEVGHTLGETMYDYQIPRLMPNNKCWCNSNKKYKKCHMNKEIRW